MTIGFGFRSAVSDFLQLRFSQLVHFLFFFIQIPCRTTMRGSFPLNGTYFQVNEVFADHETSRNPIDVPRDGIWNLPRRTVYFGTSVPSIFKEHKLFIGMLPKNASDADVAALFSKYGAIKDLKLL